VLATPLVTRLELATVPRCFCRDEAGSHLASSAGVISRLQIGSPGLFPTHSGMPPCACGGSGFVFGVGSIPEFDLFHDAFVGLVCGFNAVPAFAAFGRNHLHDRVDDSSLAWRGVTDPLTNSEFMISHGKAPFRLLQQFAR
jgi:hypothetical protein